MPRAAAKPPEKNKGVTKYADRRKSGFVVYKPRKKHTTHNKLNDAKTARRDNILVEYLLEHKGTTNAVTVKQITEHLMARGFPQKESSVGTLVRRVADQRRLPICACKQGGYYWASSKAEIEENIAELESRIAFMTAHVERLKAFIIM